MSEGAEPLILTSADREFVWLLIRRRSVDLIVIEHATVLPLGLLMDGAAAHPFLQMVLRTAALADPDAAG